MEEKGFSRLEVSLCLRDNLGMKAREVSSVYVYFKDRFVRELFARFLMMSTRPDFKPWRDRFSFHFRSTEVPPIAIEVISREYRALARSVAVFEHHLSDLKASPLDAMVSTQETFLPQLAQAFEKIKAEDPVSTRGFCSSLRPYTAHF